MPPSDDAQRRMAWSRYRVKQRRIDGRSHRAVHFVDMRRDDVQELAARFRCDIQDLLASAAFLRSVAAGMEPGSVVGGAWTDAELEALHVAAERRFQTTKEH